MINTEHPKVGQQIRSTHPYRLRSGEWATVRAVVQARGRACYLVEFADGVTDVWPMVDPSDPYEFRRVGGMIER